MFSLRNVVKRFGDITAVAGIDLEVPRGQTLALIGASGCGKSTLLRLMLGLEQADSLLAQVIEAGHTDAHLIVAQ